jgi:hypothetical protein
LLAIDHRPLRHFSRAVCGFDVARRLIDVTGLESTAVVLISTYAHADLEAKQIFDHRLPS